MKTRFAIFCAVVMLVGVAAAQGHQPDIPGGGEMNMPQVSYHGDFTGTLKTFDPSTRTVTLVRDKKGKEETFTGTVGPHPKLEDKTKSSDKSDKNRQLTLGETLKVYYETKKTKDESGTKEENVINRIDVLAAAPASAAPKQ